MDELLVGAMPLGEVIHEDIFRVRKCCGRGFSELGYVERLRVFGQGSVECFEGCAKSALAPTRMGERIGPDQVVSCKIRARGWGGTRRG